MWSQTIYILTFFKKRRISASIHLPIINIINLNLPSNSEKIQSYEFNLNLSNYNLCSAPKIYWNLLFSELYVYTFSHILKWVVLFIISQPFISGKFYKLPCLPLQCFHFNFSFVYNQWFLLWRNCILCFSVWFLRERILHMRNISFTQNIYKCIFI